MLTPIYKVEPALLRFECLKLAKETLTEPRTDDDVIKIARKFYQWCTNELAFAFENVIEEANKLKASANLQELVK